MLDKFSDTSARSGWPSRRPRGLTFYQVLTLASIVEREAQLDEEQPLIAGVYQNRLDPKKWPRGLLQSDPTIFYVHDSLELAKHAVRALAARTSFWAPIKGGCPATLPADLAGYNTYTSKGLPPGPICIADDHLDRRRARAGHQGRLPVLHRQGRRHRDERLRQDARRARHERQEVPQALSDADRRGPAGCPSPADFAAAAVGHRPRRWAEADRAARPARLDRAPRAHRGAKASTPTSASGASTCAT